MKLVCALLLCVAFILLTSTGAAQTVTGSLDGHVTDQAGAVGGEGQRADRAGVTGQGAHDRAAGRIPQVDLVAAADRQVAAGGERQAGAAGAAQPPRALAGERSWADR